MTFTTRLKEEITKNDIGQIESLVELSAFIKYAGQIKKNKITLVMENASVARRIYKDIKNNFGINIKITIRNQKRFRVKQIYILEITEKVENILETLNIMKNGKSILPEEYFLSSEEEKISFLKGRVSIMIFEKVKAIICEQFDVDPENITEDTSFIDDLGADSLDVVELAMTMEDEFGLPELTEDDVKNIHTVGELVDFINKAQG